MSDPYNEKAEDYRPFFASRKRKIALAAGVAVVLAVIVFIVMSVGSNPESSDAEQVDAPPSHGYIGSESDETMPAEPAPPARITETPLPAVTPAPHAGPTDVKPLVPPFVEVMQRKINELNAVVNAQPTVAQKMNHFFLKYCGTGGGSAYQPDEYNQYSYESGLPPSDFSDEYSEMAQKLYERLRRDLVSSDETTQSLVDFPGSFSEAVHEFC